MEMENEIYRTSELIIREPEVDEFTWKVDIPSRTQMQKNIACIGVGGLSFCGLKFTNGFLNEIDHKWSITFYANQINVQMDLPSRDRTHRYSLKPGTLELISKKQVKSSQKLVFETDGHTYLPILTWAAFWGNEDHSWDGSVDAVRVTFRIYRSFAGQCNQYVISPENAAQRKAALSSFKNCDFTDHFMNALFSDVTIQCKGESFPSHKLLLSHRSLVFKKMFETGMKEQKEGLVVINDMEPEVIRQLLKFMYCGSLDFTIMSATACIDLFKAAEMYHVEALKILCEEEMLEKMAMENCIEIYALADLYDVPLLKEKSWKIIKKYKKEIFEDAQKTGKVDLLMKTGHYPNVIYDLFNPMI